MDDDQQLRIILIAAGVVVLIPLVRAFRRGLDRQWKERKDRIEKMKSIEEGRRGGPEEPPEGR